MSGTVLIAHQIPKKSNQQATIEMHSVPEVDVMDLLRSSFLFLAAFLTVGVTAEAQFKEIGPPPMAPTVARQRIRLLLEKTDPDNRRQTITTISGLLVWYRDVFDEEIIAAWQKDSRVNLPEVIKLLADSRVASAIVGFSWRQQRAATFSLSYAPMLGDLMARYPDSARPFLDDLQKAPPLSQSEAEGVCRILLDLPDTESWKRSARQILPAYRQAAGRLLDQDARGDDQEKAYRAQVWMGELGLNTSRSTPSGFSGRYLAPADDQTTTLRPPRRAHVDASYPVVEPDPPRAPVPASPAPFLAPSAPYAGPKSGMLECRGRVIPQNGEYVFSGLPAGKLQLDYDTKTWDSRLLPGTGNSQRLVLTNKRSGTQKRCSVRWSLVP
jgi:hypothetical protein